MLLLRVFLMFYKIIYRDNPWFEEMMGSDQVPESGARPLETPLAPALRCEQQGCPECE